MAWRLKRAARGAAAPPARARKKPILPKKEKLHHSRLRAPHKTLIWQGRGVPPGFQPAGAGCTTGFCEGRETRLRGFPTQTARRLGGASVSRVAGVASTSECLKLRLAASAAEVVHLAVALGLVGGGGNIHRHPTDGVNGLCARRGSRFQRETHPLPAHRQ